MSLTQTAVFDGTSSVPRLRDEWRYWSVPAALSLALAILFIDPFAGDWDALDYTVLALRGEASSMILGRIVYLYANHALWLVAHNVFGLASENAYLLFKYSVVVQTPLAIVALWKLSRMLTRSREAATIAALLLAVCPYFIVYSGQAMAEIPSILAMCVALIVHVRGVETRRISMVLAGAALLGAAVNIREGVGLFGLWIAFGPLAYGWKVWRRDLLITALACVLFFLLALGPFLIAYTGNVAGYADRWDEWMDGTKLEQARQPVRGENAWVLLRWSIVASPIVLLALPFALVSEWRVRRWSPALVFALVGLFANASLIVHYSMVVNGRYVLTGLPALLPVVGAFFVRWHTGTRAAFARALTLSVGLSAVLTVLMYERTLVELPKIGGLNWQWPGWHARGKEYLANLRMLPPNSVTVSGGQTVATSFWTGVGAGEWRWIGTGGGWPGDEQRFVEAVREHMREGRRVFVDYDPKLWGREGWGASETRVIASLDRHFRFRHLGASWYELRPLDDAAATDRPDLNALLPPSR